VGAFFLLHEIQQIAAEANPARASHRLQSTSYCISLLGILPPNGGAKALPATSVRMGQSAVLAIFLYLADVPKPFQ
jgi:hypothetical protein